MSNVLPFPMDEKISDLEKKLRKGGEPPYDGGMELTDRVGNLEIDMRDVRDRLARVEIKLDTFPNVFATKEDLHRELHAMTWKIWGFGVALTTAVYFIAKHVTA